MAARESSQRLPPNALDLIMDLRVDLARVEERQVALGEATAKAIQAQERALQENTKILHELKNSVDTWQDRTTAVEGRVQALEDRVKEVALDLDCHKSEHTRIETAVKEEESKKKFFIFQQKITGTQASIMAVVTLVLGMLMDVLAEGLLKLFGLK